MVAVLGMPLTKLKGGRIRLGVGAVTAVTLNGAVAEDDTLLAVTVGHVPGPSRLAGMHIAVRSWNGKGKLPETVALPSPLSWKLTKWNGSLMARFCTER